MAAAAGIAALASVNHSTSSQIKPWAPRWPAPDGSPAVQLSAPKLSSTMQCHGRNRRERRLIALIVLFTMTTGLPAVRAGDRVYRHSDSPANWRLGERARWLIYKWLPNCPVLPLRSRMVEP